MHPKNIFNPKSEGFKCATFIELAEEYPELKPFLRYRFKFRKNQSIATKPHRVATIDFKDPRATRAYNAVLLKKYFGLTLELLPGSLCPAVPNRLNYIHWVEDLLGSIAFSDGVDTRAPAFHGLDIGTGSSCIHPLLICRIHASWRMSGTDINPQSIEIANRNVNTNNFIERISLFLTKEISEAVHSNLDKGACQIFQPHFFAETRRGQVTSSRFCYDFTMCNPPFYGDDTELARLREFKAKGPFGGAHEGTATELFTAGGELAFLTQMVKESYLYKDEVGWFTSMVGKKSTVLDLLRTLKQQEIHETTISELNQGKTLRWVVGWTFHKDLFEKIPLSCNTLQLCDPDLGLSTPSSKKRRLKRISHGPEACLPTKQTIALRHPNEASWACLLGHLQALNIGITVQNHTLTAKVNHPTWTRAWRRSGNPTLAKSPFSFLAHLSDPPERSLVLQLTMDFSLASEDVLLSFQSLCNHLRSFMQNTKA